MEYNQIRTVVVEDDYKASDYLISLLGCIPIIAFVGSACSKEKALPLIIEQKPELVFLDIELSDGSGFDIIDFLQKVKINPIIIFVTAHEKFAVKAFRYAAIDYLLKPFIPDELLQAVVRVQMQLGNKSNENKLNGLTEKINKTGLKKFNTRSGFVLIEPNDIAYIHADWSYSEIYCKNGRVEIASMNIGTIEQLLPADQFYRINRSNIVNLRKINRVDKKKRLCFLTLDQNELCLKISHSRISLFESIFNQADE